LGCIELGIYLSIVPI